MAYNKNPDNSTMLIVVGIGALLAWKFGWLDGILGGSALLAAPTLATADQLTLDARHFNNSHYHAEVAEVLSGIVNHDTNWINAGGSWAPGARAEFLRRYNAAVAATVAAAG